MRKIWKRHGSIRNTWLNCSEYFVLLTWHGRNIYVYQIQLFRLWTTSSKFHLNNFFRSLFSISHNVKLISKHVHIRSLYEISFCAIIHQYQRETTKIISQTLKHVLCFMLLCVLVIAFGKCIIYKHRTQSSIPRRHVSPFIDSKILCLLFLCLPVGSFSSPQEEEKIRTTFLCSQTSSTTFTKHFPSFGCAIWCYTDCLMFLFYCCSNIHSIFIPWNKQRTHIYNQT